MGRWKCRKALVLKVFISFAEWYVLMFNTFFLVVVGLGLAVLGFHFISQPVLSDFRFGVVNAGEYHALVGSVLVVAGVVILFFLLKRGRRRSREQVCDDQAN